MIIQPSPVRSDEKIIYKFNNEQILATVNEDELLFDLSNVETNKQYETQSPIRDVKRNEEGILEVTVIKYHGANATEEERFPKSFETVSEEFETDAQPVQLEELVVEEPEQQPTADERLEAMEATVLEMLGGSL